VVQSDGAGNRGTNAVLGRDGVHRLYLIQAHFWFVILSRPPGAGAWTKKCPILPADRMPRCTKAPTHTSYRVCQPLHFAFPGGGWSRALEWLVGACL